MQLVLDGGAKQGMEKAQGGRDGHSQGSQKTLQEASEAQQAKDKSRDQRLHACMAGKRIVIIGPSTAKSDYLTLAYFAEYGVWPTEDVIAYGQGKFGPNPLVEAMVSSGAAMLSPDMSAPIGKPGCLAPIPPGSETYMRYSNAVLNGHEACDCYEFGTWTTAADIYNSTENRIYINGNTMISYFQYFGDVVPPRGTFDMTPLLQQPPKAPQQPCPVGQFAGGWSWAKTLPEFLRTVVKQSNPTHIVLSASFWPIQPQNTAFWDDVAAAGVESVMNSHGQMIWKTTPQRGHESLPYRYQSPRLDMTRFAQKGWQVYPAGQVVESFQGAWPNDAVFYDFAHLRPRAQCHMSQAFLAAHVCPGVPIL